jgi:hypothetical protein
MSTIAKSDGPQSDVNLWGNAQVVLSHRAPAIARFAQRLAIAPFGASAAVEWAKR